MMRPNLLAPILACLVAPTFAQTTAPAPAPEVRRGIEMSGDRASRTRQFYERAIGKVEPSLKGDVSRIPLYLELFKREFVEDTRTFAFDVHAFLDPSQLTLVGFIEFQEHKNSLNEFFQHLGLNINDRTQVLPADSLGAKRFAVVAAEQTFIRSSPAMQGTRRENLTDCVRGDRLYLLKEAENGHLLCHAPDGYVGYVTAADVRRLDDREFSELDKAVPVRHPERIEQVIAAAERHLGTPYVWAGGTTEGVDCSGLVRASFKAAGVVMPRDADQQYLVGRLVGTRWHRSGLRRGDTLFFLGRRGTVSHTGIYLGDGKMIEATSPVVKISSFLQPTDADYSERRDDTFYFAKRVIE